MHSLTVFKNNSSLCAACITHQSYVFAFALDRLKDLTALPPGSILGPPSPLWLARVTGLFKTLPLTYRIVSE